MVTSADRHASAADLCSANASPRAEQGWCWSFTTGSSSSRLDASLDGPDGLDASSDGPDGSVARNGADGSNESYDDEYGPNGYANDARYAASNGWRSAGQQP